MYALASLRCPLVSAALPVAFAWQVWDLVHCQGVGCTPWRPSGVPWSPPLCRWLLPAETKGHRRDARAYIRPLADHQLSPTPATQKPPAERRRCGTWCTANGSDVRPGVPPVSLGLRRSAGGFCVAGAGLGARKIEG